ncbi:PREDICTED: uncharacterized protein LOC108559604 [Nicrophorus vespilloides]|uniref:Uncharacterized protein LOC108559604 n=1 Tax=Nicrophorus vespilloides TaxID=110193 RepID=A0ABM1MCX3_NICVS|nr:PREDICTED: uncharacterized protein LOC108559604 [Nicrophorus vespilloides]
MHNKGGPKSSKRRLLGLVAQSMLYAAPIWEQAMTILSYKKELETVQRRGAIRICSAYRTISRDAVQVIAGVPPIELLVLQREPWLSRKHGVTTFHLSQALSGRGCFGKYLHFIEKKEDERCWYYEKNDSPEHTLFRCCRWVGRKHKAEAALGVLL